MKALIGGCCLLLAIFIAIPDMTDEEFCRAATERSCP